MIDSVKIWGHLFEINKVVSFVNILNVHNTNTQLFSCCKNMKRFLHFPTENKSAFDNKSEFTSLQFVRLKLL